MKTLHERIPLAGFSKLPSIPQIAKVNYLAGTRAGKPVPVHLRQRWEVLGRVPGLSGQGALGGAVC